MKFNSTVALSILLVVGAALFYWAVLATSYTFTYYKIPECDKAFTVMAIGDLSRRQIAFIPGRYHEYHLPDKDYLLKDLPGGFDAYFACIPTCDASGRIIVNYSDGLFTPTIPSNSIIAKEINSEEYGILLMRAAYHPEVKIE